MKLSIAALLPLALLAGCVRETVPTGPAAPTDAIAARDRGMDAAFGATGPDGVPLAVGNRWVYRRTYRLTVLPPNAPSHVVFELSGSIALTLGCLDTTATGIYAFENAVEIQRFDNVANTSVSWRDLRQDRRGLYEIVPAKTEVPSCPELPLAPTGPGPITADPDRIVAMAAAALPATLEPAERTRALALIGRLARRAAELDRPRRSIGPRGEELMRLAYPLRPGRRWSYDDPELQTTVEARVTGREPCTVPAGTWKATRIEHSWVGRSAPTDTIESWYGPAGLLRYRYRLVAGDPGRTRYITENEQQLVRVHLADGAGALAGR